MKFPAMPACTNCGDCCGPVTATLGEVLRIRKQYAKVEWVEHEDPLTCGFYQGGLCRVYEARPAACRMYGVVREMPCLYFPESVRISLPAKDAIARGLMNERDQLLAYYFAPDGGKRMVDAANSAMRADAKADILNVRVTGWHEAVLSGGFVLRYGCEARVNEEQPHGHAVFERWRRSRSGESPQAERRQHP